MSKKNKNKNNVSGQESNKKNDKETEILTLLEKISAKMEASSFRDYIADSSKPMKIIWRNLLAGIARGIGLTVGAGFIVALTLKILYGLIRLNIPYLTELLKELISMIKSIS